MKLLIQYILTFLALAIPLVSSGQIYESMESKISFYAEAPFSDIEASNREVVSYFDQSNSLVIFDLMIEDFLFDQGLMKQHFNDHYLESEAYPTAGYVGKVYGFDPLIFGIQEVSSIGEMTIHGVTRMVRSQGKMRIDEKGQIHLVSQFNIDIEDFAIDKPLLLFQPVAETVDVLVEVSYHLTGL